MKNHGCARYGGELAGYAVEKNTYDKSRHGIKISKGCPGNFITVTVITSTVTVIVHCHWTCQLDGERCIGGLLTVRSLHN